MTSTSCGCHMKEHHWCVPSPCCRVGPLYLLTSYLPALCHQRWETPVGVIFDRFLAAAAVQHNSDSVALPFAVAVHGNGKPDDIGSCEDARLHAHYMNTLKQASFLRFGSAQPIMEMSKELQRDLWDSLKKQDLPRAEECLASTGFGSSKMKYVPVRLFVGSHAEPIQFRVERRFKSDSGDEGGSAPMVTLGDLLKTWVPDYPLLKGRPYRGVDNTFVRNCASV